MQRWHKCRICQSKDKRDKKLMKFYIETYGCQMNVSDSELITTILLNAGHEQAESIDDTDLLIFNTCSVRKHAEDRVLGRISNEKSRKNTKRSFLIAVVGCMAQRMGETLIEKGIGVDLVIGVDQYNSIPDLIENRSTSKAATAVDSDQIYHQLVPTHKSSKCGFVTIMRGCDNFCTYCIVPYVRGRERSRPVDEIVNEVRSLAQGGVGEITLLGQNVNSYNYQGVSFAGLLMILSQIPELIRLRFVTSHPKDLSDALIDVMASHTKICKHIHLPMQSGDDQILAAMNRKYTIKHYRGLVEKLRNAMPNIGITTDIIAGFPGETDAGFANTLKQIEEIRFDYAFCFKYSNREGTSAADLKNQVPEQIRLSRLQAMIDLQRDVTLEKFRAQIGKTVEIYAEDFSKKESHKLSGKTDDYKIAVATGDPQQIGSLIKVKVIDATAGTLICE